MMLHSLKNQNHTITANSTPFIYWWGTVGEDMPEIEKNSVTTNVNTLCKNMPIINVVMAEVSEEEYEDNVMNAGDCYHHLAGGRKKRQIIIITECCRQARMVISNKKRSVPTEQMVHLLVGHQEHGC